MKINPLLLGVALSLAASVACAKSHDHGDVAAKGAHGLPGSFAEGVFGNEDRKHGPPPVDRSFASNFESDASADALDLSDHDFHGDADTNQKTHSVLSAVPEPEAYVLILAGLGALALVVGRHKVNR